MAIHRFTRQFFNVRLTTFSAGICVFLPFCIAANEDTRHRYIFLGAFLIKAFKIRLLASPFMSALKKLNSLTEILLF
jgi:hypothetical protein